eukprot:SAG31_NODE_47936_length_205_cov_68.952830_1_plen_43_part_01
MSTDRYVPLRVYSYRYRYSCTRPGTAVEWYVVPVHGLSIQRTK